MKNGIHHIEALPRAAASGKRSTIEQAIYDLITDIPANDAIDLISAMLIAIFDPIAIWEPRLIWAAELAHAAGRINHDELNRKLECNSVPIYMAPQYYWTVTHVAGTLGFALASISAIHEDKWEDAHLHDMVEFFVSTIGQAAKDLGHPEYCIWHWSTKCWIGGDQPGPHPYRHIDDIPIYQKAWASLAEVCISWINRSEPRCEASDHE